MDLGTERTPLECGLHQLVKTDNRQFKGREALLERADAADRWQMVMLEINATDRRNNQTSGTAAEPGEEFIDPFYAHPVLHRDKPIGIVTSADFGHRTGKTVALALIRDRDILENVLAGKSEVKSNAEGLGVEGSGAEELGIEVLGQRFSCNVIEQAVYDPDNSRLR